MEAAIQCNLHATEIQNMIYSWIDRETGEFFIFRISRYPMRKCVCVCVRACLCIYVDFDCHISPILPFSIPSVQITVEHTLWHEGKRIRTLPKPIAPTLIHAKQVSENVHAYYSHFAHSFIRIYARIGFLSRKLALTFSRFSVYFYKFIFLLKIEHNENQ